MYEHYAYGYSNLLLPISIGCGLLAIIRYLRKRRFIESALILIAYFLPPLIFIKGQEPLFTFIESFLIYLGLDEIMLGVTAIIIFSPLMMFWIFWLYFGVLGVFFDDIDLIEYIKSHFRKEYIISKIVGIFLMALGLLLSFFPFISIGKSKLIIIFIIVSLLAYFKGAIFIALPKDGAKEIKEKIERYKRKLA